MYNTFMRCGIGPSAKQRDLTMSNYEEDKKARTDMLAREKMEEWCRYLAKNNLELSDTIRQTFIDLMDDSIEFGFNDVADLRRANESIQDAVRYLKRRKTVVKRPLG